MAPRQRLFQEEIQADGSDVPAFGSLSLPHITLEELPEPPLPPRPDPPNPHRTDLPSPPTPEQLLPPMSEPSPRHEVVHPARIVAGGRHTAARRAPRGQSNQEPYGQRYCTKGRHHLPLAAFTGQQRTCNACLERQRANRQHRRGRGLENAPQVPIPMPPAHPHQAPVPVQPEVLQDNPDAAEEFQQDFVPPDGDIQPPTQAVPLPEARRPYTEDSVQAHHLGQMNIKCPNCHALHWGAERLAGSSLTSPKFGSCCLKGKVTLPVLQEPPAELASLYTEVTEPAKEFRTHIRRYNSALAMTSKGVRVDKSINSGQGPPIYKIQGELTHRAGSLLPGDNTVAKYSQIYIYDSDAAALQQRLDNNRGALSPTTMATLQDVLYRFNPYVQTYRQAYEILRGMQHIPNVSVS